MSDDHAKAGSKSWPSDRTQAAGTVIDQGELIRRQGAGLQAVLITISVASLGASITAVSGLFRCADGIRCGPATPWMSLVPLYGMVALEGILTTRWLGRLEQRQVGKLPYRLSELITIIVVVRLYTWALGDAWPRASLLRNYLNYPSSLFSDTFFFVGVLLVIVSWLQAISWEGIFARMAIDEAEAAYYSLPRAERAKTRPMSIDRGQLVDTFVGQWMWGAILLILCTAITTFDVSGFDAEEQLRSITRTPLGSDAIASLLGYVLSGLLLLSQARIATMKVRWLIGGTKVSPRVGQSWHRNSLALVGAIAFIAAFLPLGSTFAAGRLLQAALQGLFTLFGSLFALLFALFSLFFPGKGATASQSASPSRVISPPALPAAQPNEWVSIILSSMFWAIAIVVTVAAIAFFLRDRGYAIRWGHFRGYLLAMRSWLVRFWRDLADQAIIMRRALPGRGRPRLASKQSSPRVAWKLFRFSRLSAQEQLRFLFLSAARRAGDNGLVRRLSDTPLEYAGKLKARWPDVATEVEELTAGFVKARYSRQWVRRSDVRAALPAWRRLKRELKRRRDTDPGSA